MTADKDSALLHELSHLYTKDLQLVPPVEGLSECAALSAVDASHNAASYTYFAKSEFTFFLQENKFDLE